MKKVHGHAVSSVNGKVLYCCYCLQVIDSLDEFLRSQYIDLQPQMHVFLHYMTKNKVFPASKQKADMKEV